MLSLQINGANGAYASQNETIYLAQELIQTDNLDLIIKVLLEEYGHHLDAQINLVKTVGDEGELFARLVMGKTISDEELTRIQTEDDRVEVNIDGKILTI